MRPIKRINKFERTTSSLKYYCVPSTNWFLKRVEDEVAKINNLYFVDILVNEHFCSWHITIRETAELLPYVFDEHRWILAPIKNLTMTALVENSIFCASTLTACGVCFIGGMMYLGYTIARKPPTAWEASKLQLYMLYKGRNLTSIEIVYYCLFKRNGWDSAMFQFTVKGTFLFIK